MSNKVVVSAKVEEPLRDDLEQYCQDKGRAKSAAVRDFVKEGIERDEMEQDGVYVTYPAIAAVAGFFLIAMTWMDAIDAAGYLGVALILGSTLYNLNKRYNT